MQNLAPLEAADSKGVPGSDFWSVRSGARPSLGFQRVTDPFDMLIVQASGAANSILDDVPDPGHRLAFESSGMQI